MESKVHRQEQHMQVYWEHSASGLQAKDSNTNEENEKYVIQKP
jgi:hypothetical protein